MYKNFCFYCFGYNRLGLKPFIVNLADIQLRPNNVSTVVHYCLCYFSVLCYFHYKFFNIAWHSVKWLNGQRKWLFHMPPKHVSCSFSVSFFCNCRIMCLLHFTTTNTTCNTDIYQKKTTKQKKGVKFLIISNYATILSWFFNYNHNNPPKNKKKIKNC